jgi:CheY-like chemotaxis protein
MKNRTEAAQVNPQSPESETILVVEDYDGIRLVMKQYLEKCGYRVLEAADGKQAVEIARRECLHICLILMDINLPISDGIATTRQIRKIKQLCDVPIVACTARSSTEQRETALAAGCSDLVAKPMDLNTMKTILDRYLPEK